MADYTGTAGNDSWTLVGPDTFSLDALGGFDTLDLGTSLRSSYRVTRGADGAVMVDSVSGASGELHATLYNVEQLLFNNGRDRIDLTTFFGPATLPPVSGTNGNDSFTATAGHQAFDGLAGTDLLNLGGARAGYTLTHTVTGYTVSATNGSTIDDLVNIERLHFADQSLALDVGAAQSAGQAILLLGTVLPGRLAFDPSKAALMGVVIGFFDVGFSSRDLSGAMLRLPIWDVLTGRPNPTNADIANYLLSNVNGAAPDAATLSAATAALNTESIQGTWLANLVASAASQTHVGLVGLADVGLPYLGG